MSTYRKLFRQIMDYRDLDRMPVIQWKGWENTTRRWIQKEMPEGVNYGIDVELDRPKELIADGGYTVLPGHLIAPGVSLGDYAYYLSGVREQKV